MLGGFFANGIHEDILNHLAKIDGLEVISRTTVLQYRGPEKSAQEIGRELDAGSILEGSVRRQGDRFGSSPSSSIPGRKPISGPKPSIPKIPMSSESRARSLRRSPGPSRSS